MMKHILLASAVMISVPALAQNTPAPTDPVPVTDVNPAQTSPTTAAPAQVQPAPAPDNITQAAQATDPAIAAAPVSKAEQVATVVNKEFPSYDKNNDGKLDDTEFAAWMVALKTASDPTTKADSPATRTWVGQAFASADTDKNKSVSKTELNAFLSQG